MAPCRATQRARLELPGLEARRDDDGLVHFDLIDLKGGQIGIRNVAVMDPYEAEAEFSIPLSSLHVYGDFPGGMVGSAAFVEEVE